jgi:hypothetical protein
MRGALEGLLMGEERLVLSERGGVDVGGLLLRLLHQVGLLLGQEGLVLLWAQRGSPLARPHVNGAGPRVLHGRPGAACPCGAGGGVRRGWLGGGAGALGTALLTPLAGALAAAVGASPLGGSAIAGVPSGGVVLLLLLGWGLT